MKSQVKNILLALAVTISFTSCEDFIIGKDFLEKPIADNKTMDDIWSAKEYAEQHLAQAYTSLYDFHPINNQRLKTGTLEGITDLGDYAKTNGWSRYHGNSLDPLSKSNMQAIPFVFYDDTSTLAEGDRKYAATGVFAIGVRQAWQFIENVDKVPDMTDEEKAQRKAEAKMILAIHYTHAFRYLGGLPWIGQTYASTDEFNFPRMTIEETVEKITALIDEAIPDLPWRVENPATDSGRMTAAVGVALKARLKLFAASPIFNADAPYLDGEASAAKLTWWGDYSVDRWQDALDAHMEFIAMNDKAPRQYSLEDYHESTDEDPLTGRSGARRGYLNSFMIRDNSEAIIETRRTNVWTYSFQVFGKHYSKGSTVSTLKLMELYEFTSGEKFDWTKIHGNVTAMDGNTGRPLTIEGGCPYFGLNEAGVPDNTLPIRDPRLYEVLAVNGDTYGTRTVQGYVGGLETPIAKAGKAPWGVSGSSGAGFRKWHSDWMSLEDLGWQQNLPFTCVYMRLPEIYLGIAEALNEIGGPTKKGTDGHDAYYWINKVRTRVGMPDVDQSIYNTKELLRKYILDERAREFPREEVRYYDIVRHKLFEEWSSPLTRYETALQSGAPGTDTFTGYNYTLYNSVDLYQAERLWLKRNDATTIAKWYILPFHQEEVNKGYGLVQNPGW